MSADRWSRAAAALLAAALLGPLRARAADLERGKQVFIDRCAPCHGDHGAGDGPAAAAMTPKPRNFQDPDFWRGRTVVQLKLVVKQGKPGTLMAPFEGVLSDGEIDAVVDYLQSFRPRSR